ncbi:type II secretion system F family protein [Lentilactobacillus kosonis]|uniref:Late competence protein ComGB, access of DNA to ComEA n=1 Tax=Lentilactobacillus kosonis TaxID=2810561 RepID=A0A401FLB3_9LACO|nr:type II secretion system F family protein [Lentilactobacillus kosonis]GAY73160.1 late competence protein ComGB, access of DNA to ComEA [Lentilactobacillus kosonis]
MVKLTALKPAAINSDRWSIKVKTQFFKSVGTLICSGFSLNHALLFISETEPQLTRAIEKITANLANGESFAGSVRQFLDIETYQQILVAEKHGQLSTTLKELAKFFDARERQAKKIQELLAYPIFLIAILTLIVIGIKVIIMPSVSDITNTGSHASSRNLFGWLIILVGIVVFGMIVVFIRKKNNLQRITILVKLPIMGKVVRAYLNYYLSGNLAVLLKNGLSIKKIIELLHTFDQQSLLYSLGASLNRDLVGGTDIIVVASQYQFISREMINFLNSGMTTPQVAQSMSAYSQNCFAEFANQIDRLINLVQPVMFCVIGIAIVASYFQLLMPIYDSLKEIY